MDLQGTVIFILGCLVTWAVSRYYYRKQAKDAAPLTKQVSKILTMVETRTLTKDQAAQALIKALDTGAIAADDLETRIAEYRHCPECLSQVQIIGSWSAPESGGHTIKCTKCNWRAVFEW